MVRRRTVAIYDLSEVNGEPVGIYIPEQIVILEEDQPLLAGIIMEGPIEFLWFHHQQPSLCILSHILKDPEKREKVKEFLLWLDERLPEGKVEHLGFVAERGEYEKKNLLVAPHPDDYARIKEGRRKRINEIIEWELFFGELSDEFIQSLEEEIP
ncbi:MAG: hypothetical protein N3B10_11760 [Armatimonadetes bacterium]|nr:hypothetical protein [Armatimonadota bacterium]